MPLGDSSYLPVQKHTYCPFGNISFNLFVCPLTAEGGAITSLIISQCSVASGLTYIGNAGLRVDSFHL